MRVLVVEDDVRLASLIRKTLREEGLLVDVAVNGEDALWMAASSPYDVMTVDVSLPGIDGFEVTRRLREDTVWIPTLMLTARDDVEYRIAPQRGRHAVDEGVPAARGLHAPPGSGAEPLPAAPAEVGERCVAGATTAALRSYRIRRLSTSGEEYQMSSAEIRAHLLELARERTEAERAGLSANEAYMADLEDEIVAYRLALVGAAVTEIAVLRGELFGREFG